MRVPGNGPMQSFGALQTLVEKLEARKSDTAPSPAGAQPAAKDPDVTISGRALLKQRLFDIIGPSPRVAAQTARFEADRQALTQADKALLGDIYVWASEQGADLGHVDKLGRELAGYRAGGAAKPPANGAAKGVVPEGTGTAPKAPPASGAATKLLSSDALKTSRLDAGFIQHALRTSAGRTPLELEFLDKVINRFSTDGGSAQVLGAAFSATGKSSASGAQGTVADSKPLTLESLRLDRVAAAMKALGVKSLSGLWDKMSAIGVRRS